MNCTINTILKTITLHNNIKIKDLIEELSSMLKDYKNYTIIIEEEREKEPKINIFEYLHNISDHDQADN
jgi:hypothetical protein